MASRTSPNAHMTLSPEGEAYIKLAEEEGGKPKLKAYNDGTGTWTIAWGCTKGVTQGMKITLAQAEQMFAEEIAGHVAEVHRYITVPVSQGLFDALVSFFFNNGPGKCPTLIKAVNSGSGTKTRQAWMLYVKAFDEKLGRKVTWPGLVNRRTAELAHWAKMDAKAHKLDPFAKPPEIAEPVKPGWVTTAVRSKTVWLQIQSIWLLVVGWFTDWGKAAMEWISTLFAAAPDIANDASAKISTAQQFSEWFGLNLKGMTLMIVVSCAIIALIRHTNDKRAAS
jgi:lysozyme